MNDFKRNDRFGGKRTGGSFGGTKPMFEATCATCGKPCQVPFKPDGSRPIYCREHYGNKSSIPAPAGPFRPRPQAPFQPRFPASSQPRPQAPDPRIDELKRLVEKLILKVDQALLHVAVEKAQAGATAVRPKTKKKLSKKK